MTALQAKPAAHRALHYGRPSAPAAPEVVAVGAFNSLGFDAYQTWAFWRAEQMDLTESPFVCENGERASMAKVRTLPFRCMGAERILALAQPALEELKPALDALPPEARVGLFVGVSERFGPSKESPYLAQRRQLEAGFERWHQAQKREGPVQLREAGHAAFAFALLDAVEQLTARSLAAAIVGAADTYYDPAVVTELIVSERIYDGLNVDTIIPGEGAAFLLLTRPDVRRSRGASLARIESVSIAHEPATFFSELPCTGEGLGLAMRAVCQRLKADGRQLEWVLGDLTNEPYRTHEWGLAFPRAVAPGGLDAGKGFFQIAADRLDTDQLPENFGDLGAATMATAAVLAVESFQRGVPAVRNCLLHASAMSSHRGAVLIAAPSA
jgi:3-oxoacyl-[acyl-carrier-protein] synthase-1